MNVGRTRSNPMVLLASALLTSVIFYVDMHVPLGIAIGSLYILVVLVALWFPRGKAVITTAAICSALVIWGWMWKPAVGEMWKVVFNRLLALFTIWATALLCVRIKAIQQELVKIATHDFLTGLLNRREMFDRLQAETSRADRMASPFSLILLDIDLFKGINDHYGHHAGDEVLKKLAGILKQSVRAYDYVCRYGGEEFVVVTPETTLQVAHELAERLRRTVMQAKFPLSGAAAISVTISAGVAQQRPGEAASTLISRADAALYRAKEAGRNRVEVSENA